MAIRLKHWFVKIKSPLSLLDFGNEICFARTKVPLLILRQDLIKDLGLFKVVEISKLIGKYTKVVVLFV